MVISLVLVIGCFSSSCATVEKRIEEANENHEIVEKKIQIDAPEGFKIDTQRYYDNLKDYCSEMGK